MDEIDFSLLLRNLLGDSVALLVDLFLSLAQFRKEKVELWD